MAPSRNQTLDDNRSSRQSVSNIQDTNITSKTAKQSKQTNQAKSTPMDQQSKSEDQLKLLDNIRSKSPEKLSNEDVNKNHANVEDLNKKKVSWASNYLQSIGHNNIKPIKINLSKSKHSKIETISTKYESNVIDTPTLFKESTSYIKDFNMSDNSAQFSNPKEKKTSSHITVGNLKTLHPNNVKSSGHTARAPVRPRNDTKPTQLNSNIVLDTIYSNKNSNSKAPAYATLLAKGNGESTYCYKDGKCEIDIFNAIKSKINRESAIEQQTRSINIPTHKDMCEEFIKEISNKPSTCERKHGYPTSTTKTKKEDLERHSKKPSTANSDTKLVKKDKKIIKESLENKKNKTSYKEKPKKSKYSSSEEDNPVKKKKKLEEKKTKYKKLQSSKPNVDLKDFEIHAKPYNIAKETGIKPKIESQSPVKQILKRVRTISEELHNLHSENRTHSPVKSVVRKTENCHDNPPKRQCLERDENFDLRSKLSRVNQRIHRQQTMENDLNTAQTREKLKISVENQNNDKQKSPKKSSALKYKKKKCKKLKLVINVVCQESDDETTSSDSSFSETNPTHNIDLSFLDDFNVDEIVDSLKHSPKHKTKNPLPNDNRLEDITKMSAESELNLTTLLNILQAKTETNKLKNSVKTECRLKIEEINNLTKPEQNNPKLVPDIKMEETKKNVLKEDIIKIDSNKNTNTTHALVKILSETKSQLDKQNATSSATLDKCGSQGKESNGAVINTNQEEQPSEDTDSFIIDESVIIDEPEISIIDLTNETKSRLDQQNTTSSATLDKCGSQGKESNGAVINTNQEEQPNEDTDRFIIDESVIIDEPAISIIDLTNETKSQLDQQNTTSSATLDKCGSQGKESNGAVINTNQEEQPTEDTDRFIIDESVIIDEPEISIIDLTNETLCPTLKTNNAEIDATSDYVKTEKPNIENIKMDYETENYLEQMHCNNLVKNTNDETEINKTATSMDVEIDVVSLDKKKESITDLTDDTLNDNVQEVQNNANIQKHIENEIIMKQELHNLIPLPNTKPQNTDDKHGKDNIISVETNEKPKDTDQIVNLINNNKHIDSAIKTKEPSTLAVSDNTMKVDNKTNIKNKEKSKESVQNIVEPNKMVNATTSENMNITKVFETKAGKKLLKDIVDNVWDTKGEVENTSKPKENVNKNGKTSNELKPGNVPKTNNTTIEKKVTPQSNKSKQHEALVMLLEERMLDYLQKEIKVIKHIRHGKYSNIFCCKDSTTGETYAAKILKNETNRHSMGIQKEQMLRQLQQDIPRENINTIYLIDGFGIKRYWCFLTEFYPKNLQQALKELKKPFHIDLVQNLARQLISAVMVLRNNQIIHSDIKPSHILLNSTNDRLKLCGFDGAYNINDAYPVPNIGTLCYRAPEIILGFSAGYSVDIWSSALVIYQMATNLRLFTGAYNNEILYQQMCTFGNFPWNMIERSLYKNCHFQGRTFMKRVGYKGQDAILFEKFYKTRRLHASLIDGYNKHWMTKEAYQRDSDLYKLAALYRLLEQMLLLDPRFRLAVEFVSADPFIYEIFS